MLEYTRSVPTRFSTHVCLLDEFRLETKILKIFIDIFVEEKSMSQNSVPDNLPGFLATRGFISREYHSVVLKRIHPFAAQLVLPIG
jgi:hypothetical protein